MPEKARVKYPEGMKKAKPDLSAKPASGSNGPTRDDGLFMLGQFIAYQKAIDAANALKRHTRSRAKNMGLNLKQFDAAIAEREREDGTTFGNFQDFKKYAEWFDLPIAKQIHVSDKPAAEDAEDLMKKAYQDGYDRGVMALDPDWQAYPKGTQESESHLQGIVAGQKVNLEKFEAHNAQMAQMQEQEDKVKAKQKAAKKKAAEDAAAASAKPEESPTPVDDLIEEIVDHV